MNATTARMIVMQKPVAQILQEVSIASVIKATQGMVHIVKVGRKENFNSFLE